ncbi:MAG TPA: chromosome segregation protein SMC [Candidatus Xenobia bacterium]
MYLRRIEISGFKTFADDTRLEFGPGITGIVGPNGSGKSNLTDALRFSLGEQNPRVLRGSRMEEMIFAGSKTRRPVGLAEVTAVFDNSDGYFPIDFAEIAVTRKLFRGGDTAWSINGTPCRMKDVHELFMGTGLGHGAIAILGAREIAMVLSQDAQERKLILEEAAGVMKYKLRKKDAQKKLEAVRENASRLRDIHREVETNLQVAAVQLEQYHRYRAVQAQQRNLSRDLIVWETWDLREQKATLIRKGADDDERLAVLLDQMSAAGERLAEARRVGESHLEARDMARTRLSTLKVARERVSGRKAVLDERERALQQECETRQEMLTSVDTRLSTLDSEAGQFNERRASLEGQLAEAATELDGRREQERQLSSQLQQEVPRLVEAEQRLQSITRSRAVMEERQQSLAERIDKAGVRLTDIAAARQKLETEEQSHARVMKAHESDTQGVLAKVKAEEAELGRLRTLRVKLDEDVEKVARRYEQVEDGYHQKSSRLAALRDLESEMAGHGQGVRLILSDAEKFPGVLGLVSDLIHVRSGQEMAFEAALGAHLSDMVVERNEDARRCIEFLKASRAGRVTFWPLDLRRPKHQGKPWLPNNLGGVVGWAPDLVGFDEKYDAIVQALLGRTVVMEELPAAVKIYEALVREARFIPTLVTLDGELMAAGGSISGGYQKSGRNGLLSRKRERQELEEETVSLKAEFNALRERRKALDAELKGLRQKGDEVRNRLLQAQREASEAHAGIASVKVRLQGFVDEKLRLAREEQVAVEDRAQATESRERLLQDLANLADEEQAMAAVVAELGGEREKLRSERDRWSAAVQEQRLVWARVSQSLQELEVAVGQAMPHRLELQKERAALDAALLESRRALDALGAERLQWSAESAGLSADFEAIEAQLQQLEAEAGEKLQAVAVLEQEVETLRARHGSLHEKVLVRRAQLDAMDEKIETSVARLAELELSAEDVDWDQVAPGDRQAARRELNQATQELRTFGAVNLGAVEDYERLQERNEFLRGQLQDLTDASNEITRTILDMDETSSKLLGKTFKDISTQFSELFSRLFRGGKAYLELTDPHNLLSTGVEIIAQPPGKRLQNLGLLSSGERAITAIAFLLATLKVRPSPFVVLDELDAPLDDANVERVAQVLLEFAEKSQFLIITHNRKTMEYASVLYGVTMVEPGTAEVVAVSLEESARHAEQPVEVQAQGLPAA